MSINPILLTAIERNQKWIEKKCRICERNPTKNEELVNDVLVNLYASSKNFSDKESINADAWVKKITTNVTAAYIGQELKEKELFDHHSQDHEPQQESKSGVAHDLQVVIDYINHRMTAKDRQIMQLYLMKESQATIAEIIGLEVATITNRISILKKELTDFLTRGQS